MKVQKILGKKFVRGKPYYKVKWQGKHKDQATWQSPPALLDVKWMINSYQKKMWGTICDQKFFNQELYLSKNFPILKGRSKEKRNRRTKKQEERRKSQQSNQEDSGINQENVETDQDPEAYSNFTATCQIKRQGSEMDSNQSLNTRFQNKVIDALKKYKNLEEQAKVIQQESKKIKIIESINQEEQMTKRQEKNQVERVKSIRKRKRKSKNKTKSIKKQSSQQKQIPEIVKQENDNFQKRCFIDLSQKQQKLLSNYKISLNYLGIQSQAEQEKSQTPNQRKSIYNNQYQHTENSLKKIFHLEKSKAGNHIYLIEDYSQKLMKLNTDEMLDKYPIQLLDFLEQTMCSKGIL